MLEAGVFLISMSCNDSKDKSQKMNIDQQMMEIDNTEVQEWLDGLNRAMRAGGDPDHNPKGLASKGEPTSKFAEFIFSVQLLSDFIHI